MWHGTRRTDSDQPSRTAETFGNASRSFFSIWGSRPATVFRQDGSATESTRRPPENEAGTTLRLSLGARRFSAVIEVYGRRTRYTTTYDDPILPLAGDAI